MKYRIDWLNFFIRMGSLIFLLLFWGIVISACVSAATDVVHTVEPMVGKWWL